jgi:low temperature requirement protein LtrA
MSRFLRQTGDGEEQRATTLELFFDLVFVFAITQLSHYLVAHLDLEGAAETFFLLLVVWWAWIYTTWMTNWFDPESPVVRSVLIAVMLASLLMAIAIPEAFGDRALLFASAYAGLQILRNAFAVYGSPPGSPLRLALARILLWSVAVGVLWVLGGALGGTALIAIWLVALVLDYAGPYAGYWNPMLGRSPTTEWEIESAHFSERFQLFVIIALGESIVVTGATAADLDMTLARGTAIAVAFLSSAALWWLYFDYVARIAQLRLDAADDRGRLARDAYTYLHIPMIAGIIVTAVGDELVIAHPGEGLTGPELAAVVGGPVLYLLGHVGFRLRMAHTLSGKRLTAALMLCVVGAIGAFIPALATATLVLVVLVGLIVAEIVAGMRRRARGLPTPVEQVEQRLQQLRLEQQRVGTIEAP